MIGDMPDMITGGQVSDYAVRGDEAKSEKKSAFSERELELFNDRSRWFVEKNLWQRSAIVFAGPAFNFILAFVLILVNAVTFGEGYVAKEAMIGTISEGSPAAHSGIKLGDRVIALQGKPMLHWRESLVRGELRLPEGMPKPTLADVTEWQALAHAIRYGDTDQIDVRVERGGPGGTPEQLDFHIVAQKKESQVGGSTETVYLIGIGPEFGHRPISFLGATSLAFRWTVNASWHTFTGVMGMLSGAVSPKELAGPLFILGEANRQAEKGLEDLLSFMAILSISLAVLNLLPIPVLDGGHLLFFFMEAVLGPISVKKKEVAQQVGMFLLLCLMVFAIRNDINRRSDPPPQSVSWEQPEKKADAKAEDRSTAGTEAR